MQALPLLVIVALTSALAYGLGVTVFGLSRTGVRRAATIAVEIVGFGAAFFALNVVISMTAALALRRAGGFFSLYASSDVVLLLFSMLQGLVFATWRQTGRRGDGR